jgi:uncharacterized protein YjbJ (UPF0337 family)
VSELTDAGDEPLELDERRSVRQQQKSRTDRKLALSTRQEAPFVSSTDETKGRIKQAAGDLTDDNDLKREGKVDEASGKAKEKADQLVDKVADSLKKND